MTGQNVRYFISFISFYTLSIFLQYCYLVPFTCHFHCPLFYLFLPSLRKKSVLLRLILRPLYPFRAFISFRFLPCSSLIPFTCYFNNKYFPSSFLSFPYNKTVLLLVFFLFVYTCLILPSTFVYPDFLSHPFHLSTPPFFISQYPNNNRWSYRFPWLSWQERVEFLPKMIKICYCLYISCFFSSG